MANINSYASDQTIHANDKLIGSDGTTGADFGKTKNFTVGDIKDYVISFVDEATTLSTTVTLTPAQMLSFNGGGQIEILPQPEAGKAYYIKTVQLHLDFNTTVYDANTYLRLMIANEDLTLETLIAEFTSTIINSSSGNDVLYFPTPTSYGVFLRQDPLILWSPLSMNITQGDSNIKFKVNYEILDIEL